MIETNHMHQANAARARQEYAKNGLVEKTDRELIRLYRKIDTVWKDTTFNSIALGNMPEDIYTAAAAIDILRDRHGNKFAKAVVRGKPQTRAQSLRYFLSDMVRPLFQQRAVA